jgi:putative photosynthetic complex assembly protein
MLDAVGPDLPFRLTHWSDGRLTLEDAATGRRIELESFGPTNMQAFASLLAAGKGAP